MPPSTLKPNAMLRVFYALWPDQPSSQALHQLALQVARSREGRATREQSLHVTVAFVGAVDRDRLPALCVAGSHAADTSCPFRLVLDRLGGAGRDGIAWLAPSTMPTEVVVLHGTLAQALAQRGFPIERRPFRPHVTLARRCSRSAASSDASAVSWWVDRLALVVSTPASDGSHYQTLAEWRLPAPLDQAVGTV